MHIFIRRRSYIYICVCICIWMGPNIQTCHFLLCSLLKGPVGLLYFESGLSMLKIEKHVLRWLSESADRVRLMYPGQLKATSPDFTLNGGLYAE